jgi:hypothetical protein
MLFYYCQRHYKINPSVTNLNGFFLQRMLSLMVPLITDSQLKINGSVYLRKNKIRKKFGKYCL